MKKLRRYVAERFLPAIAVASLFVLVSLAHMGHDWEIPEEARKRANPRPVTEESLATGKGLYEKFCQACHGPGGGGDGPLASMLNEKPPALNDPEEIGALTDGELHWMISKGTPPMPGFEKKASEEERWDIVNHVRSFSSEKK